MQRVLPILGLVFLAACGGASTAADGGGPAPDAGREDATLSDAGEVPDSGAPEVDAGGVPDSGAPEADAGSPPADAGSAVDCQALVQAGASLCHAEPDRCEAVFSDGVGCTQLCQAAGLTCTGAYEDRDDSCAPDLTRPPTTCDSGHRSDFCVCGGDGLPLTPDPGGPPDPAAILLAERAGFGRNAAGGDPSRVYRVTTLADSGSGSLRTALESNEPWSIVFDVEGTITWASEVRVRANKTVDGRGHDVTVDGTWRIQEVRNVIISDLRLTRSIRSGEQACGQDGDVILVRGPGGASPADFNTKDLWFHHLELFSGGDGLLDLRGATGVTISWCHFHSHKKVTLAWQDMNGDPTPGMEVTWHHNFFDRTTVRNPRLHYGKAHFYNNYLLEWWQYGANAVDGAQLYSEANIYEAADNCVGRCVDANPCGDDNDLFVDRKVAVAFNEDGNPDGFTKSVADSLLNGARFAENRPTQVFDAPSRYPYVADVPDAQLAQRIAAEAGPR